MNVKNKRTNETGRTIDLKIEINVVEINERSKLMFHYLHKSLLSIRLINLLNFARMKLA